MKLPKKDHVRSSQGTSTRGDVEQTMTMYKGTAAITTYNEKKKHIKKNRIFKYIGNFTIKTG